jgi:hypothetical protein
LSHSEIPGSRCVCHSPGLIAAYRVLRRLSMPRHSLHTLTILKQLLAYRRNMCFINSSKCQRTKNLFQSSIFNFDIEHWILIVFFHEADPLIPAGRFRACFPDSAHFGADRSRTCDFVLAKHALSQLSYSPKLGAVGTPAELQPLLLEFKIRKPKKSGFRTWRLTFSERNMGLDRFELSTPSLSEKCSNQLSYRPQ